MKTSFLILALMPALGFANPTYDATRGALQNNSALCGYGYNPNCSSGNTDRHIVENITINLPSKYGAIARGSAGSLGSSMNENSKSEAIKAALTRCNAVQGNGKCKVVATVRNGCQSLSEGKIGKNFKLFYGTGKNSQRGQSEAAALRKCQKSGAQDCRILMPEECSLPEIPN